MAEDFAAAIARLTKQMERLADEVERQGAAALGLGPTGQPAPLAFGVGSLGKGQGYATLDQAGNFSGSFFADRRQAELFADAHRRAYDALAAKLAPAPTPAQAAPLGMAVARYVAPELGIPPAAGVLTPTPRAIPLGNWAAATPGSPLAGAAGWARAAAGGSRDSAYDRRRRMEEVLARPAPGTGLMPVGGAGGLPGAIPPIRATNFRYVYGVAGALGSGGAGGLGPPGGGGWAGAAPAPGGGSRGWGWGGNGTGPTAARVTSFRPGSFGGGKSRQSRWQRWARMKAGATGQRFGAAAARHTSAAGQRWAFKAARRFGPGAAAWAGRAASFSPGAAAWAGRAGRAAFTAAATKFPTAATGVAAAGVAAGGLIRLAAALGPPAAAVAAFAAAVVAGTKLMYGSVAAMRQFGEHQNESNRWAGRFDRGIAGAFGQLDRNQYFRDVDFARATSGTAITLARGTDRARQQWAGWDQFVQNQTNRAGGFATGFSGQVGQSLSRLAGFVGPQLDALDPNGVKSQAAGAAAAAYALDWIEHPIDNATTFGGHAKDAAKTAFKDSVDNSKKPDVGADRWAGGITDLIKAGPIRGPRVMPPL